MSEICGEEQLEFPPLSSLGSYFTPFAEAYMLYEPSMHKNIRYKVHRFPRGNLPWKTSSVTYRRALATKPPTALCVSGSSASRHVNGIQESRADMIISPPLSDLWGPLLPTVRCGLLLSAASSANSLPSSAVSFCPLRISSLSPSSVRRDLACSLSQPAAYSLFSSAISALRIGPARCGLSLVAAHRSDLPSSPSLSSPSPSRRGLPSLLGAHCCAPLAAVCCPSRRCDLPSLFVVRLSRLLVATLADCSCPPRPLAARALPSAFIAMSSSDSTTATPTADRLAPAPELRDELRITTLSLSGKTSFIPWVHSVRRVLQAKGLARHLTQGPPSPTTDDWLRNDGRVQTWILNSLEGEPYQMIMYHETAKAMWDELHSLYSGKDSLQHLFYIITDLQALDVGKAVDMTSFVARAKTLTEAWIQHQPSTTDLAAQCAQKEAVCIAMIMARVPPHLHSIRAQVLASPATPSFSDVCCMLLRVPPPLEASAPPSPTLLQQTLPPLLPPPSSTRGCRTGSRGRGRGGRGRLKCSYCGRDGHTEAVCHNKHGYPPRPPTAATADSPSPTSTDLEALRLQLQQLQGLLNPPSALVTSTSTAGIASTSTTGTACLSSSSRWILDSGATHHITLLLPSRFSDAPHPTSITVANGAIVPVSGCADLLIYPSISLHFALYVPASPFNLLSVGRLTHDMNCYITFTSSGFLIQDRLTQITIVRGRLQNGLYLLDVSPSALSSVSSTDWHCRLGHAPLPILQKALPDPHSSFLAHCTRSSAPFDLIHSDIWGPYKVTSISGYRYFIKFIDDYSRTTWLSLLRDRSELPRVFRAFVLETRTHFSTTIKTIRSDNAREYTSHEFANLCADFGIVHQTSCSYTSQQNGVAEQKNRHLLDVARSLMLHMHVPKVYWNFAVSTACFLINRIPSSVLQNATSFSLLFPSAQAFPLTPRVFGCTCFVHTLGPTIDKMDPRAAKHIFVGYSCTQKGYVCYSPDTRKVFVSADVTFREDQPFFPPPLPPLLPPTTLPPSIPWPVIPVNPPLPLPQSTPSSP
ncbi:hypothetical protein KSP39_PZI013609 [Platanthera zijinensis]|uniref:Integrase catalytic domain-containing protein n=1 Tax=Platanthera zijinensis TaxID=2320716 RepID=A0AAP0BE65_9ASPA